MASGVWIWQADHTGETGVFSGDKLGVLHAGALDACDLLDGVKDGVIGNPQKLPVRSGDIAV
jgi:hypothetical protein